MKILLYNWYDNSSPDACEVLCRMGHTVGEVKYSLSNKLHEPVFEAKLCEMVREYHFDAIFSFDYFPVLTLIAENCGIKYISWVYDSPHDTLYSNMVFSECNYIFCFDRLDTDRLIGMGVKHAYHMPLAVNTRRLDELLLGGKMQDTKLEEIALAHITADRDYDYEVSFVGSLYRDNNYYDSIRMPEYYRGYFDGVLRTQMELYGYDIVPEVITDAVFRNIESAFDIDKNDDLFITKKQYFIQFLHKKITSIERVEILKDLSEKYDVTLFSGSTDEELKRVLYKGYVDYGKEMPQVFYKSRINLNISLRSIISGIPLRCMDIMGAGGFLLSNYQPELSEFFVDGEEMVMFTSKKDLMDKVEYYLSHDKVRRDIAYNGWRKIHEEYSMDMKLREIMDITFLSSP